MTSITIVTKNETVETIDAIAYRNASTRSATSARLLEEALAARERSETP